MKCRILAALSVALLTPTLGGCFQFANSQGRASIANDPAPAQRECARILRKVPDPGARVDEDFQIIAGRYRGAFIKANKRIAAGAECEENRAGVIERGGK
jgi:hypothetical protein